MDSLDLNQWTWLAVAAVGIGVSKSGLSGLSMVHVLVFASVFGAKDSTGIVLPMLIVGDIAATARFGQHANWPQIRRVMLPAMIGVVIGWLLMYRLDESLYRPIIGLIILLLTIMQLVRLWRSDWFASVPNSKWFAWLIGILVGFSTMIANAAGPIFALFLLALAIPKMNFIGTGAWFFLLLNVSKIPFSWSLGLIDLDSLWLNLILAPLIVVGLWLGEKIVKRIPRRLFDSLILLFTAIAALRMLLSSLFLDS